jgi:hypothetical protein
MAEGSKMGGTGGFCWSGYQKSSEDFEGALDFGEGFGGETGLGFFLHAEEFAEAAAAFVVAEVPGEKVLHLGVFEPFLEFFDDRPMVSRISA